MNRDKIIKYFNDNVDLKYRDFHAKLVPNVCEFKGVRLPLIRVLAKEIAKGDYDAYFRHVCFDTYEERMLCGLVIANMKCDFIVLEKYICFFVPIIDNWAVCDSFCMGLKLTKKYKKEMYILVSEYANSSKCYEIRFAVVMLFSYFIDDDDDIDEVFDVFNKISNDDYYVRMAIAWAVSICFIKQRTKTLRYLENNMLDNWTHNKSIQKITESLRVSDSDKKFVRSLKK